MAAKPKIPRKFKDYGPMVVIFVILLFLAVVSSIILIAFPDDEDTPIPTQLRPVLEYSAMMLVPIACTVTGLIFLATAPPLGIALLITGAVSSMYILYKYANSSDQTKVVPPPAGGQDSPVVGPPTS